MPLSNDEVDCGLIFLLAGTQGRDSAKYRRKCSKLSAEVATLAYSY